MFKEEALEVLRNRRAIRKFKPDQITEEELNAVLEAGTFAPTGEGRQSPLIVAVQTPEYVKRVDTISGALMGFRFSAYYGAPTILLIFENNKGNGCRNRHNRRLCRMYEYGECGICRRSRLLLDSSMQRGF